MQVKNLFLLRGPTGVHGQDTEICISCGETEAYIIFERIARDSSSWPLMARPIIIDVQVNLSLMHFLR